MPIKGGKLIVKMYLNDRCKNGYETFGVSISKEYHRFGRTDVEGGSMYDTDVRICLKKNGIKAFPKVLGCDMMGAHVCALANSIYFLKDKGKKAFQEYLRLTDEEAEEAQYVDDELGLYTWLVDHGVRHRWEAEARSAIGEIIGDRDIAFVSRAISNPDKLFAHCQISPSKLHDKDASMDDNMDFARMLFAEGYYTKEGCEARARQAALNKVRDTLSTRIKWEEEKVQNARINVGIYKAVSKCIEKHYAELDNPTGLIEDVIYYGHDRTVAFNWRTRTESKRSVSRKDYEIFVASASKFLEQNNLQTELK